MCVTLVSLGRMIFRCFTDFFSLHIHFYNFRVLGSIPESVLGSVPGSIPGSVLGSVPGIYSWGIPESVPGSIPGRVLGSFLTLESGINVALRLLIF